MGAACSPRSAKGRHGRLPVAGGQLAVVLSATLNQVPPQQNSPVTYRFPSPVIESPDHSVIEDPVSSSGAPDAQLCAVHGAAQLFSAGVPNGPRN